MIVHFGFQKFENEKELEYQLRASEALANINSILTKRLKNEKKRPVSDYYYFKRPIGEISSSNIRIADVTSLARLREPHFMYDLHGIIGYFNINQRTQLNIPGLPYSSLKKNLIAELRINKNKIEEQLEQKSEIKSILINSGFLIEDESTPIQQDKLILSKSSEFQLFETKNNKYIFYRTVELKGRTLIQSFIVHKKEYLLNLIGSYVRRACFDHQMLIQLKDQSTPNDQKYQHYKIDSRGKRTTNLIDRPITTLTEVAVFQGA